MTTAPNTRTNTHRDRERIGDGADRWGNEWSVDLVPFIGEQGDDYGDLVEFFLGPQAPGEKVRGLFMSREQARRLHAALGRALEQAAVDTRQQAALETRGKRA